MQNIFKRQSAPFYTASNSRKFILMSSPNLLLCFFQLLALGAIQKKLILSLTWLQSEIYNIFSFLPMTVSRTFLKWLHPFKQKNRTVIFALITVFLTNKILCSLGLFQQQVTETQHKWIKHKELIADISLKTRGRAGVEQAWMLIWYYQESTSLHFSPAVFLLLIHFLAGSSFVVFIWPPAVVTCVKRGHLFPISTRKITELTIIV